MAKTKADLIADWRQHIGQPDSSNSQFSDAQGLIWLNDAYRAICAKLRHLPTTERDYSIAAYSAASGVTLNSETLAIDQVLIKNPDSLNPDGSAKRQGLRVINLDELLAMDPDYQAVTADMPIYAVRKDTFTLILYPTPKASVKAQTTPLRTYGLENPTALSADSDTPNLPGNLHDVLPHWPAYRAFAAMENQAKVTEHLTLWNSRLKDNKGLATEFSAQKKHWTFGPGVA